MHFSGPVTVTVGQRQQFIYLFFRCRANVVTVTSTADHRKSNNNKNRATHVQTLLHLSSCWQGGDPQGWLSALLPQVTSRRLHGGDGEGGGGPNALGISQIPLTKLQQGNIGPSQQQWGRRESKNQNTDDSCWTKPISWSTQVDCSNIQLWGHPQLNHSGWLLTQWCPLVPFFQLYMLLWCCSNFITEILFNHLVKPPTEVGVFQLFAFSLPVNFRWE